MGFVSDNASTHISRIVFSEFDGDNNFPDSNIGYDSIRIAAAIPEPETYAMLLAGLCMIVFIARRDGHKVL